VLHHVGERLLRDPVQPSLHHGGKAAVGGVEIGLDGEPGEVEVRLHVPPQGRGKAKVVEHGRPQVVDEQLDLREAVRDQRAGVGHTVLDLRAAPLETPQGHVDVEQCGGQ
jgi:hypothetical protein